MKQKEILINESSGRTEVRLKQKVNPGETFSVKERLLFENQLEIVLSVPGTRVANRGLRIRY